MKAEFTVMASVLLVAVSLGCVSIAQEATRAPQPQVVSHVDLERYMGKWYEIASIPTSFQRRCVGETTAHYDLLENGRVSVLNRCRTKDGYKQAQGRARVEDPATNARLRVSFVNFLGRWWYIFGGDYWVIELADDYSWAVVGHPDRDYGWVLSRTPELPQATLLEISNRLRAQGYNPLEFITTPQPGGPNNDISGTSLQTPNF